MFEHLLLYCGFLREDNSAPWGLDYYPERAGQGQTVIIIGRKLHEEELEISLRCAENAVKRLVHLEEEGTYTLLRDSDLLRNHSAIVVYMEEFITEEEEEVLNKLAETGYLVLAAGAGSGDGRRFLVAGTGFTG